MKANVFNLTHCFSCGDIRGFPPARERHRAANILKAAPYDYYPMLSQILSISEQEDVYSHYCIQKYTINQMVSKSENQAVYCYQQLIVSMQQSEILPGDYLREQLLAKEFGVSRTPVREALRKLETEGLVQSEPRLGMRVRALDYAEVVELYEVREVHERAVARLAATKATEIELDELKELQADLERAKDDPKTMALLNLRFHIALLRMAKNRFLTRAVETMQRTILLLGPSTLNDPKRAEAAIREHRALIKALQNNDADKAEAIMSAHLRNAQRLRIRQIQREPFSG